MAAPDTKSSGEQKDTDMLYEFYAEIEGFSKVKQETPVKASELEESAKVAFRRLIGGNKGSEKARQLSALLIPKVAGVFPSMIQDAVKAQFDLCEDDSVLTRQEAVRGLGTICKQHSVYVPPITSVLAQMLDTTEANELATIKQTFTQLFAINSSMAFQSLLSVARESGVGAPRSLQIQFVLAEIKKQLPHIVKDEQTQISIADGIKALLSDEQLGVRDFAALIKCAQVLPIVQQDADFKRSIVENIIKQSQLNNKVVQSKDDIVGKAAWCMKLLTDEFIEKSEIDVGPCIDLFFTKIAPVMTQMAVATQIHYGRSIARFARHASKETAKRHLAALYELMKAQFPTGAGMDTQDVQFSVIECLLHIFHQFAAKSPATVRSVCGLFTPSGQPADFRDDVLARQKEFRDRAETLMKHCDKYGQQLAQILKGSPKPEVKSQCETHKSALRSILTLSKPLIGAKPKYLEFGVVPYSWNKAPEKKAGLKRSRPSESESKENGKATKKQKKQPRGATDRFYSAPHGGGASRKRALAQNGTGGGGNAANKRARRGRGGRGAGKQRGGRRGNRGNRRW
eukprot:103868_1